MRHFTPPQFWSDPHLRHFLRGSAGLALVAMLLGSTAASAMSVVATIPVGADPYFVAVNSATDRIYATSYRAGTLSTILGANNKVQRTLPVASAWSVAINPRTSLVYVVSRDTGVSIISASSGKLLDFLALRGAESVAVNATTNRIYVAKLGTSNQLVVLDGETNSVVDTVPNIGLGETKTAVNEATNRIYVANEVSGTLAVIDGLANTVVSTLPIPSAYGVGVNPITNRIYVGTLADTLTVVDGATNVLLTTIVIPAGPSVAGVGVKFGVNEANNRIYVSTSGQDSVSVIDGNTNQVVATIPLPAGADPTDVAVNSKTGRIYVANSGNGTVSVLQD